MIVPPADIESMVLTLHWAGTGPDICEPFQACQDLRAPTASHPDQTAHLGETPGSVGQ